MNKLEQAYIALNRFGFGAQTGQPAKIAASGTAQWLDRQIAQGHDFVRKLGDGSLRSAGERYAEFTAAQRSKDQKKIRETRRGQRQEFNDEMLIRMEQAVTTPMPFAERLVHFWSNHFTVSAKAKGQFTGVMGAYEREAIRPHVFGRFEDLLIAVESHPAMLIYLDNRQSIGPNSAAGKRRKRGLNENLAREILELHTLGVNGGYTQDDVIALAKIITGWSIKYPKQDGPEGFKFQWRTHEPGQKILLGKRYGSQAPYKNNQEAEYMGAQEGRAALRDLARHPATARFIATKLARHFVADDPPESAIKALENDFLKTGGDLKSLYRSLVRLPEVWANALPKFKSPHDYLITVLRMMELDFDQDKRFKNRMRQALVMMDHQPFMALSPAGWGDTEADWLSPDSLMNRIEWVHSFTSLYQGNMRDPGEFAKDTIGAIASPTELTAIAQAPSKGDGFALTLLSPAVMRR